MYYTLEIDGLIEFDGTQEEVIKAAQKYANEYWLPGDDILSHEYDLVCYSDKEYEDEVSRVEVSFYPDWDESEVSDYQQHNIWNKAQTGVK